MTKLLYQTNSYLKTFEAVVTEVHPDLSAIVLDQTVFYPGGGGQPHDRGTLHVNGQSMPVVRLKKSGESVLHFLDSLAPLPQVGDALTGELDWELRYKLMRTHTAMHILCGVIFRDYGASVTGGEMEPLQGRMDFEFETMQKELVELIEQAINREVQNSRPISVDILPREQAFQIPDLIRTKINLLPPGIEFVRVVEIEGLDLQADGGTHVANTQEVGRLKVLDYKSKGKINKRIYLQIED